MIGQIISHYKILDKIGEGGMGVVYKAQDTRLDRIVALKFLPEHLLSDPSAKARFIQEAKGASAINHPNITTVYDIGEADGKSFIAMECIEGKTLKELAQENLKLNQVLEIAIQTAEGLSAAHKKEIVHRDIKSDNIMLSKDNAAKIMDFGLAKLKGAEKLTQSGATVGTVAYMSPEQTRGEAIDRRSDIFSFGVVLYELIAGRLPFQGEHNTAISYSICFDNPEPLARFKSDIPDRLQRLVDKTLQKDRAMRYQSAADLTTDLKAMKREIEGAGRAPGPARSARRGRKLAAISAAAIGVLLLAGTIYWWRQSDLRKDENVAVSPAVYRIAVLPFANISADPADEYLADGMTDEMISTLSKISGFRVIARTSVMQYKTRPKSISEIGRELRVGSVLEGSVRKAADLLRITTKLVNVKNQEGVWSQEYDLPFGNVFGVQTDVAQRVAEALQVGVQSGEKRRLEKKPTENSEAYKLYLKGRYHVANLTEETAKKALEYFKQAVGVDPTYALAYAGMSDAYYRLSNVWQPPKEMMPKARAAALKALELDESLAEAHTSLATVKAFYDWDWPAAEREFQRSIELNPGYASAHQSYGILLGARGWSEKALSELQLAQELDPLSTDIAVTALWPFCFAPPSARQYERAITELQKIIKLDPDFQWAHAVLGMLYREKRMFPEAIAELKQAVAVDDNAYNVAYLGSVYAKAGMKEKAQKLLADLVQRSKSQHIASMALAMLYAGMGENDSAFANLQKAYEARDEDMIRLNVEPLFDGLRTDPRFIALVHKMGLEK